MVSIGFFQEKNEKNTIARKRALIVGLPCVVEKRKTKKLRGAFMH